MSGLEAAVAAVSGETRGSAGAAGVSVSLSDGSTVQPDLVGGVLAAHAAAFGAKGSRVFTPCGATAFCYSARTGKCMGSLHPHSARVTAVIGGPTHKEAAEPVATGSANGEVWIWNSKDILVLAKLNLQAPVVAMRWPAADVLLVEVSNGKGGTEVEQIDTTSLAGAKRFGAIPLSAQNEGPFDAAGRGVALCDGSTLLVWCQGWARPHRFSNRQKSVLFTSVSVDPMGRYVAVGDQKGVVWLYWGALEDGYDHAHKQPARWHWHSQPVRCLAHCGPVLLSGGDEGVLCIRNVDDDATTFVPRFPSPLKHMATSQDGKHVCISLEENALALIDGLHGNVVPRYIHALDVPIASYVADGEKAQRAYGAALHPLASGALACTGGGKRVQFINAHGKVLPMKPLTISHSNTIWRAGQQQRWTLRQVAFSANAESLLTCEVRRCPAMERFDGEEAPRSSVLKWWCSSEGGQYEVDSMANDPHTSDVTVALAHPTREHTFVTASLDGTFKTWGRRPIGTKFNASKTNETKETASGSCWQCVSQGSWRNRPVLSGCYSTDGSTLALGFHGFAVLFDDQSNELRALPAGEACDRVVQLHSAVAADRFLLLANVHGPTTQEVVCWDLARLTVLARLDLSSAIAGERRCVTRIAPSPDGSLRVLTFRAPGDKLKVWKLAATSSGVSFEAEASATLPQKCRVLDAAFTNGSSVGEDKPEESKCRLLCWTSDYELWNLALSSDGDVVAHKTEGVVEETAEKALGPAARIVGDQASEKKASTMPVSYQGLRFLDFPSRTTPEQQAGLAPHLVERVVPPHVPSHMLPPPPVLWESLLSVFAKAAPGVEQAAQQARGERAEAETAAGAADPAAWASEDVLQPSAASEFAEASWLDGLLGEALTAV